MNADLPLVSLVCAAGSDGASLTSFHGTLFRVLRALESTYRFEVIYAGDHTCGAALAQMDALAQLDPRVRILPAVEGAGWDAAQRHGLAGATGAMAIILDAKLHPPEVLPQLLEQAQGPCTQVAAVPMQPPPGTGFARLLPNKKNSSAPAFVLLKRPAIDAILKTPNSSAGLLDQVRANGLPCVEISFVPNSAAAEAAALPRPSLVADTLAAFRANPWGIVTYFGAVVFGIGVFLALWFSIQGMIAPGSVWFSWSYLIVLLHILGGSTLFALGKVGALAGRILEQSEQRLAASASNDAADAAPTILPLLRRRNAA